MSALLYISVPTSGLVEDAQIPIDNDQYGQDYKWVRQGDSSSWAVETQEDGWLIYWTKVVEDVSARQEEDMQRVGAA